jgi:hypothetical protein
LMKNMSGIDAANRSPLQGSDTWVAASPRALPWATLECPVGAASLCPNGAIQCDDRYSRRRGRSDIARSGIGGHVGIPLLCIGERVGTPRSYCRGRAGIPRSGRRGRAGTRALPFATLGCPFGADNLCPNGAKYLSPGQRPGFTATHILQALKGRHNR